MVIYLFIIDFDIIENSNLSRSVLFRESDNGKGKASIAASSAKNIYPEIKTAYFNGNAVTDIGLGVFHWADVIVCGLDSREARLGINRSAYKVNKPWVDGAIEGLDGIARVFIPPEGACYECTMNKQDWKLLQSRRACNLLTKDQILEGKTPTTPTIASIVAGIQCQETVKLLHSIKSLQGSGIVFNGLANNIFTVNYQRKENCYSHNTFSRIIKLDRGTSEITIKELFDLIRKKTKTESITIELNNEYLNKLTCDSCKTSNEVFIPINKAKKSDLICENCKKEMRFETISSIYGDEDLINLSFQEIGVPDFEILNIRTDNNSFAILFAGDEKKVLGELCE